jgi:hypothetical protein
MYFILYGAQTELQEKDIEVIIDSELTFENHLCEKVKKATSIFAAMRRTFKYLDTKSFLVIYNTLVRTHVLTFLRMKFEKPLTTPFFLFGEIIL